MNTVYLDHAATTPVLDVVKSAMPQILEYYGNPSSAHIEGTKVKEKIINARKFLAREFNISDEGVLFTSGGTEANNQIINSFINGSGKILISSIEHPSVKNPASLAKDNLINIPYKNGEIDYEFLCEKLDKETINLVSVMSVNNETGLKNDCGKIGRLIKEISPNTKFHVDAVQNFAKEKINIRRDLIDFLSFSSHKFGGLKGSGGIISSHNLKKTLIPLIYGGGQEMGMRSGTENLVSIESTRIALEYWINNRSKIHRNNEKIGKIIKESIKEENGFTPLWDNNGEFANWIYSFAVVGIQTPEVIVRSLAESGICISSGSACHTGKIVENSVMKNLGYKEEAAAMLRISLGWNSEINHIEIFLEKFKEVLESIVKK